MESSILPIDKNVEACAIHRMIKTGRSAVAMVFLSLTAIALPNVSAKGLAEVKGRYSGVLLVTQAPNNEIVSPAKFRITSKNAGRNGTMRIARRRGARTPAQNFTFRNGIATVNVILPGLRGDFAVPASGTYRTTSNGIRGNLVSAHPDPWRIRFFIERERGDGIVRLTCIINVNGGDTIYYTLIGG